MTYDEGNPPSERHDGPNGQPRGRHGQFAHDPDTAKQDARCAELRSQGMTYRQIAAELGIGVTTARDGVERTMLSVRAEPGAMARAVELEKLDGLEQRAREVLNADHVVVSHGRVVHEIVGRNEDGAPIYGGPLVDHEPVLKAIETLRRLAERRAKLLGLDAPTGVMISRQEAYSVGSLEQEIAERTAALKAAGVDVDAVLGRNRGQ